MMMIKNSLNTSRKKYTKRNAVRFYILQPAPRKWWPWPPMYLINRKIVTPFVITRVNGPRRTRNKNSRVALKSATRVFCSVLVQGFGPPHGTPHVPRVRLHWSRDGLFKFDAASMPNWSQICRGRRGISGVWRGGRVECHAGRQNLARGHCKTPAWHFLVPRGSFFCESVSGH